ncbi:MAG TPA: hypothetical protein VGX37_05180 [Allosphingosinicella sp.]|nr:hypothetical protein [Allosphingosinicella sp.]
MANTTSASRSRTAAASRSNIASLERTVEALQRTVLLIAEANAVPNLLANGFEEISMKLEPLRNLSPAVAPMRPPAARILLQLRRDLDRPDWSLDGDRELREQLLHEQY